MLFQFPFYRKQKLWSSINQNVLLYSEQEDDFYFLMFTDQTLTPWYTPQLHIHPLYNLCQT